MRVLIYYTTGCGKKQEGISKKRQKPAEFRSRGVFGTLRGAFGAERGGVWHVARGGLARCVGALGTLRGCA